MFSSNDTPAEEFVLADELGATINLDDITHIDFLEKDHRSHSRDHLLPLSIPAAYFQLGESKEGFQVMDNPGDSKYGFTREQIFEGFKLLKAKGAKRFGIHAFLASNTISNDYYPALAGQLFELAVELKRETGADIRFINLSGGVGVPYRPEQPEPTTSSPLARVCVRSTRRSLCPPVWAMWPSTPSWAALCWLPTVMLVTRAIHEKHTYKEYIGRGRLRCQPDASGHVRRLPPYHRHGQGKRSL